MDDLLKKFFFSRCFLLVILQGFISTMRIYHYHDYSISMNRLSAIPRLCKYASQEILSNNHALLASYNIDQQFGGFSLKYMILLDHKEFSNYVSKKVNHSLLIRQNFLCIPFYIIENQLSFHMEYFALYLHFHFPNVHHLDLTVFF